MSEQQITTSAIDSVEPGATGEGARDIAAALVRSGTMTTAEANAALAARGAVALAEGSREELSAARARLMGDYAFCERVLAGDPASMRQLSDIDLRLSNASGALTDRSAAPASSYSFDTASRFQGQLNSEDIRNVDAGLTDWAISLELPPGLATSLVTSARDADARPSYERDYFASTQEALFHKAAGANATARLEAAAATLKARSGRDVNLAGLVKTAGAEVAIALLHHAEALATRKGR